MVKNLDGQERLPDLPLEELLLGEAELVDVAGDLLRDGAGALVAAALDEVGRGGDEIGRAHV